MEINCLFCCQCNKNANVVKIDFRLWDLLICYTILLLYSNYIVNCQYVCEISLCVWVYVFYVGYMVLNICMHTVFKRTI